MIKVQDWTASIPEEEKHIAYVGENMTEQREFLLCGEGWEKYKNWSFHLDMAFDSTSITTRDCRQVVQTTVNNVKHTEEVNVTEDSVTTKETYTVCDEEVLNYDLTDVASLDKWVEENGIDLTEQLDEETVETIEELMENTLCARWRNPMGSYPLRKGTITIAGTDDDGLCVATLVGSTGQYVVDDYILRNGEALWAEVMALLVECGGVT